MPQSATKHKLPLPFLTHLPSLALYWLAPTAIPQLDNSAYGKHTLIWIIWMTSSQGWRRCGRNHGSRLCSTSQRRRSFCPLCFGQHSNSWGSSVTRSGTPCSLPWLHLHSFPAPTTAHKLLCCHSLGGAHGNTPSSAWRWVNKGFLWEMGHKWFTQSRKSVWVSLTEMSAETE